MKEVLLRRFKHDELPVPDMILVDGEPDMSIWH